MADAFQARKGAGARAIAARGDYAERPGPARRDRHVPSRHPAAVSHRPGVDRRFPRYPGLAASRRTSPEPLASRRREHTRIRLPAAARITPRRHRSQG